MAVANYFLELAEKEGKQLTPMQVQKLVYFAHGWHLALTGRPLIEEQVEAWTYGPVIPALYHAFKEFGGGPIEGRATELRVDVNPATGRRTILRVVTPTLDNECEVADLEYIKSLVKRVWEVYGEWSAVQLSQMTHEPGGPWDVTHSQNPDRKGTDIADQVIREYFLKKVPHKSERSGANVT
jgi:uncharacterized phage-associated protein